MTKRNKSCVKLKNRELIMYQKTVQKQSSQIFFGLCFSSCVVCLRQIERKSSADVRVHIPQLFQVFNESKRPNVKFFFYRFDVLRFSDGF